MKNAHLCCTFRYLWLAHRDTASPAWDLAVHSKRLWELWLQSEDLPQLTEEAVEFQVCGEGLEMSLCLNFSPHARIVP